MRPETVNEKTGFLLKKMNCTHVAMGIECGDNEVARKILKRNTTNERIIEAAEILRKNNVKLMTQPYFMKFIKNYLNFPTP